MSYDVFPVFEQLIKWKGHRCQLMISTKCVRSGNVSVWRSGNSVDAEGQSPHSLE